jgi:hypothetical protein
MHSLFHNGKVEFKQIKQFGLHRWPSLQARQNKSCNFNALPTSPGAANYDWNI